MLPPPPDLLRTHQQKQAACYPPTPSLLAQFATPTALRQGGEQHSPLTVLVSVAYFAQRDGSGGSRLSKTRIYSCAIYIMGISNCR